MSALSFHVASAEDASMLASLINAAFRSEKTGQTWLFDSQDKRKDIVSTELIAGLIDGSDAMMIIGTSSGSPVATCFLSKPVADAMHRTPGAAWMGFLAVSPSQHNNGYGLAMLKELERIVVKEWGLRRLEFDFVNTRSQLRAWYEKHGYTATGKSRPFPYGQGDRDILASGLEMIVLGKDL